MSAKLALRNLKKSFKDYTIYFLTIAFGVCLFYVFSSLDNQPAMASLSDSQKKYYKILVKAINGTSIFVSFILAFLILYANRFLIKRRKKELSIYMLLGMDKSKISKVIVFETLFTGLVALAVGTVVGIFASQGLSLVVAHLFEVKNKNFEFAFSGSAVIKTLIYFGIIFLVVMIFNAVNISKCKLITLMQSAKKNEKTKIKNLPLSLLMFAMSAASLAFAYHKIIKNSFYYFNKDFKLAIAFGILGTVLFFISLSGFITFIANHSKRFYYKRLNIFTVRQFTNKVNTNCASMTVICLMLLITIGIIACAMGVRNGLTDNVEACNLQDASYINNCQLPIFENADNDELKIKATKEDEANKKLFNAEKFYNDPQLNKIADKKVLFNVFVAETTYNKLMKNSSETNEMDMYSPLEAVSLSDYNKIMDMRGNEHLELSDNEYALTCNVTQMLKLYSVKNMPDIKCGGESLKYKGGEIIKTQFMNMPMKENIGVLIVPDKVVEKLSSYQCQLLVNFKGGKNYRDEFNALADKYQSEVDKATQTQNSSLNATATAMYLTKIDSKEGISGLAILATFISIYIGIVFLISSCAVLSLQQLSESADNAYRYKLLRKLGASTKDLNSALFKQVGSYFLLPLLLAVVHVIFGIKAAIPAIETFGDINITKVASITGVIIIAIYCIYFTVTYFTSKSIIKKD